MPVATAVQEIRSSVKNELLCRIFEALLAKTPFSVVIDCSVCRTRTASSAKHILVYGEYRCFDCFRKMVHNQKGQFGVGEDVTDADVGALLEEIPNYPFILNLWKLKVVPGFLSI